MGMYDDLHVAEKVITPLLVGELAPLKGKWLPYEGRYYFQTKDLENALFRYEIKDNLELYLTKWEFKKDASAKFGVLSEEKEPVFCADVTANVEFYDSVENADENDDFFVTFKARIVCGVMEDIEVKEVMRWNRVQRENEIRCTQERWEKIRQHWAWRLFMFLTNLEHKTWYKIDKKYRNFLWKLREYAESKYPENHDNNSTEAK